MAYPIARRSFFPFARFFAKRIEGVDHLPVDAPVILAANHLGLFDPLFIGSVYIGRTKKKLRYLVDTRNMFWKTMGITLSHWTNTIPIRPGRRQEALDMAVQYLRQGDSVGVFPEGRVNTSPTLLSGRSGAIRMSLRSGVAIVPVGIGNTNVRMMTIIGRRFISRQEGISLRFGVPYRPTGNPDDENEVRRLTDDLMHRIAGLSGKPYAP